MLERQFPVVSPDQRISLRTAKDYADWLAIHNNYLNKDKTINFELWSF